MATMRGTRSPLCSRSRSRPTSGRILRRRSALQERSDRRREADARQPMDATEEEALLDEFDLPLGFDYHRMSACGGTHP